jgi:hypothetical protein
MKKSVEQLATQHLAQIKVQAPDLWFEVIEQAYLLAVEDHLGYTPAGLDPELRKRLDALQTSLTLTGKFPHER